MIMGAFLTRLFERQGWSRATAVMDRTYVSDYTRFMEQFIDAHPEILVDQNKGWRIYWEKRVDLAAQEKAEKDTIPDDGYGFRYLAWNSRKEPAAPDGGARWGNELLGRH